MGQSGSLKLTGCACAMKAGKLENARDAPVPAAEEAINLTLRSDLMSSIKKVVEGWKLPQGEVAGRFGISC